MSDGLPSRRVALALIAHVLEDRRPLDEMFERRAFRDLPDRERAFARQLAGTVLRRLGQIDDALKRCLDRPLKGRALRVRGVLRLAAAELLFLETAAHAAVNSAVSLVHPPAYRGLANAVLRRIDREREALLAAQDAERLNCPAWLWRRWCQAYGEATTRAILEAQLAPPALDLTPRDDAAAWARRLDARLLPTGSLRGPVGDVTGLPGFRQGAWWVQDAAAALPARLLGPLEGRRALDLCAAPGGKTLQLAAAGARVTAVDQSQSRLSRLRDNLARTGLEATLVAADAGDWRPDAPFEAVLLDAPCTATGTIRRHPDIARLKTPDDVAAMAVLQRRLLGAAAGMLAPGGRLVFCTCSLEPEEGAAQADWARSNLPLDPDPIDPAEIGGDADWRTKDGDLRTLPAHWPGLGGLDGFFVARFRARS